MARIHTDRQARFTAALALAKMSKTAWAAAQEPPVHRVYLNTCLRAASDSHHLMVKVDRFIAQVEKRFRAKVAA